MKNNFKILVYSAINNKDKQAELSMTIEKNNVTIELDQEELKRLIAMLPKTFGEKY